MKSTGLLFSATASQRGCHRGVRGCVVCLVLCIAAAQGDACPIVNEGRWPWVAYYVLSGARYDPEHTGAVAIPPRPRLFVLRRFNDTAPRRRPRPLPGSPFRPAAVQ